MAKLYRPLNRNQEFLLPPNMDEWLPADDPVWLVITFVDRLDTTPLDGLRRTGGVGRAGYDPAMLLTLLIWGWSQGCRSSRVLEKLCRRDVTYRIICGGDPPDHVTISRFRAAAAPLMPGLFSQVLAACAKLGMGQLGVVALDGVKISSNASGSANRTEKHLVTARDAEINKLRELLAGTAIQASLEHASNDDASGDADGEVVPAQVVFGSDRLDRLDAALASAIEHNAAAAQMQSTPKDPVALEQAERDRDAARVEFVANWMTAWELNPQGRGVAPYEVRVQVAQAALDNARAVHQCKVDAHRPGQRGAPPKPVEEAYAVRKAQQRLDIAREEVAAWELKQQHKREKTAAARADLAARGPSKAHRANPDTMRNITDPQSRPMQLRGGGWIQGYNCQAVTTSDGLIIATSVSNSFSDSPQFIAMMAKAVVAAQLIVTHQSEDAHQQPDDGGDVFDVNKLIGILLADAGYLSNANITAPGPDRLIATKQFHKLPADTDELPPLGDDATPIDLMTHRLATPEGRALYKQRSHIAETPFGQAKHNMKFRQFTSRGLQRADAEFAFNAIVHNITKAINSGHLTHAT